MMFTCNIAKPGEPVDINKISKLLSESLPGNKNLLQKRFRALMTANFSQNVYTVLDDNNDIASVLIYFEDIFYYKNNQLSVIYLSHLATAEKYRGSGTTRKIMDFVQVNLCNNYDLIYGYPRKSLRGFWSKVGFTELTNTNVKLFKIPKRYLPINPKYDWVDATESDIPEIVKISGHPQNSRLIRVLRDEKKWKHIYLCQKDFQFRLLVCKSSNSKLHAYCSIQDGIVTEFCTVESNVIYLINTNLATYIEGEDLPILNRGIVMNNYKLLLDWSLEFIRISDTGPWDLVLFSKHKKLLNTLIEFESSKSSDFTCSTQSTQELLGSNFLTLDSY